jgi:hypothetical protein
MSEEDPVESILDRISRGKYSKATIDKMIQEATTRQFLDPATDKIRIVMAVRIPLKNRIDLHRSKFACTLDFDPRDFEEIGGKEFAIEKLKASLRLFLERE